ncbi:MAG: gamma-glutamyltransferase family protein [Pseudomonadota bacterium]
MFTTRPEIQGTFGVVASTHWLASAAGMAMLELGGNAFDAAVATGFALQVVEPHLNGPGGEVPILIHDSKRGAPELICGQGPAPAGATIEHYRGLGLELVPGSGLLATVIPGAFDAWMRLLRDHGTLTPREVMTHAIDYAGGGYPMVPGISSTIERVQELFESEWTTSAYLYLPGGQVPQAGSLFQNQALADCYNRMLSEAEAASSNRDSQIEALRRIWSQGFVADAIDHFCRHQEIMDTSERRQKGVMTGHDMATWEAGIEEPLSYDYFGHRIYKGGVWNQGPVFLQQLALLKHTGIADMDPLGPEFVHTVTEAAKLAFADREAFYGDPNFVDVPISTLLSDDYNQHRAGLIGDHASMDLRPGQIEGFASRIVIGSNSAEKRFSALGGGEPTVQSNGASRGDTCHLDIIDRQGNMVSATPSGGWLQSSPIIPELGFCLNSRAQMFWLEDGLPSSLAPGKRPRTTLSANLVFKDNEPLMAFGTPGGDYQDQWSLTFFLRHIHHDMNLQEAIDCPMFQTDHMPSSFWPRQADPGSLHLENRFPTDTVKKLRSQGHRVQTVEDWSLGRLSAARRDGRLLRSAANPRMMQGYAVGR